MDKRTGSRFGIRKVPTTSPPPHLPDDPNIAADRTLSLVRVLCFQVLPEVLDRNTRTQLVLFIIETVDKTAREDAIASILRDLVSEATSVVAVEITYYCLHRDYSPRINDLIDTGQIKDLVNTLLDARYLQEKWDIFEDLPHHFDLAYVLAQWGHGFSDFKEESAESPGLPDDHLVGESKENTPVTHGIHAVLGR